MATLKLISEINGEDSQILKLDNSTRFIVNHNNDWQFLFALGSDFTASTQVVKIAAEFDTDTLTDLRVAAYLYNTVSGGIDNASSCTINIYRVEKIISPQWNDMPIYTTSGVEQSNSYFFTQIDTGLLTGAELDGNTTLMVEVLITRLGKQYRDRVYVNHLGVYDSILRLRQDIEFLDITKLDE